MLLSSSQCCGPVVVPRGRPARRSRRCLRPVAAEKQAERDVSAKAVAAPEPELKTTPSGKIKLPWGSSEKAPKPVPTAEVKQPSKEKAILFQGTHLPSHV